jgi:acyl-CoA reductase-like NAD-dependent aldehyde dehydrogenase
MQEAGLPPGVVNSSPAWRAAGAALAATRSGQVAFTGSTEVDRLIVQTAGAQSEASSLDSAAIPNIVLEDADLDVAIPNAASAIFSTTVSVAAPARGFTYTSGCSTRWWRSVGSGQGDQARLGP